MGQAPLTPGSRALSQGRLAEARALFWTEAIAADAKDDATGLAEAALGLGGLWVNEHRSTLEGARVLALQRRALAAVDGGSSLAGRLRVRLAAEQAYRSGEAGAVFAMVDTARAERDRLVLADALSLAHHCLLGPNDADIRLALADELVEVAATTNRPMDGLMGLMWRTVDLFLLGDRRARRSLHELRDHLEAQRCDALAYVVAALEVMLAMRAGDLDGAERLAATCRDLGAAVGDADALGWYAAQLVAIRWSQGRGGELLPLLADLDESATVAESNDALTAGIAALAAAAGETEVARSALARLRSRGLGQLQPASVWMVSLSAVCEAAHALGDVEAAREGYQLLEPFAHLPVMASLAIACYGSAHRPLGLAAWTMGDLDRAVRHLELAEMADRALENRPCHAMSLAHLAGAVEAAGHDGSTSRAAELRAEAIFEAVRCRMTSRAEEWARRDHEPPVVDCRRKGPMWVISVGGRTASVPHNVGMGYLGELIAHPDVAIPAVELASGYSMSHDGLAQPVLDDIARSQYRRRIEDLRAEIGDAEQYADIERASRARYELDTLLDALARATGLSGRDRGLDNDSERARVSVRKAIVRALDTIADADPEVAAELRARVVTGTRCVFNTRAIG